MSTHTARVRLAGPGGTVEIDGTDLSSATRAFTITGAVDTVPTITLDLIVYHADVDGEARVEVPQDTAAALVVLGWTPPGEQPPAGWLEEALRSRVHRPAVEAEVRRLARVDQAWARSLPVHRPRSHA